ncbi:MAG: cytochrome c family protein [Cypionkella sp.]|uniref:c-type cytochrome n=1 Tax=Cypionkella sp. TaxID=2811411 RepID=UPI00261A44EB|nr:cytochrome c family protein [Cypionkella sp.]MDB5658416.1 cytochrome c family protein [Cypionkella sp.]MDB5665937.1 cytochrome c family protein [Cypionkella sp.]
MFDTMTLTKATGAICGSLLVYLFISWAGEAVYHGGGAEGHGGEEVAQAYSIAVEEAAPAGDAAAEGPPWAEVFAAADPVKGEVVFKKCAACHKVDGTNGTGPHLNGVVGRPRGSVEGFAYSEAMASDNTPWTPELLDPFIHNPKADVPGTKMGFAGLPKVQDRADVIAYLATMK